MRHTLPLLERDVELAEIDHLLTIAASGRGGLLLLGGEAGIGKTALLERIIARAAGYATVVGRAPGPGETPLFGPLLQVVQRLTSQHQAEAGALPPPFGAGANLPPFAQAGALAAWLGANPGGPLLIALEDIHWADGATLELLKHLPGHLAEQPVLVVATYRTDELNRDHPLWTLLPHWQRLGAHRILLRRLTPQAVGHMASLALGERCDLDEVALRLYQRTGGLPLFVQEMLHSLTTRPDPHDAFLPETVQQVIDSLLARLSPETQKVLQAAAVIGEHFDWALLSRVTGADEEGLVAALEEALGFHLIQPLAEQGERYRFNHALVRERLQERLIGPRRRRWHLRVAEALLPDPASDVEAVAYHLRQAGDERAVDYLCTAGKRTYQIGVLAQAARYFAQALEVAGPAHRRRPEILLCLAMPYFESDQQRYIQLMSQARQEAEAMGDRATAFFARLRLLPSMSRQMPFDQLMAEHEALALEEATLFPEGERRPVPLTGTHRSVAVLRVHRLAEAARTAETMALIADLRARPLDPAENETLRISELWLALHTGRFAEAMDTITQEVPIRLANQHLLYGVLLQFLKLLLLTLTRADQPAEVDRAEAEALALEGRVRERAGLSIQAGGDSMAGFYRFLRGDWEQGAPNVLASLAAGGDRSGYMRQAAGRVHLALGRPAEALAAMAPLPPVRPGAPFTLSDSPFPFEVFDYRVQAHLLLGEVEQARAWVESGEEWLGQGDFRTGRSAVSLARARLCLHTGDGDGARAAAARAVAQAAELSLLLDLIGAQRLLGEAEAGLGHLPDARRAFEASLHLAERCRFPYEAALTRLAWGRTMGRAPEARLLLEEARECFARLGAGPALAESEALAGGAAQAEVAAAAQTPTPLTDLTEREVEVARLVARGLSDKEVGAQLHISPRTVDGHLRNVYSKLCINSRAALTGWAIRQGLAE